MKVSSITIEPMQAKYNRQVGQLLVHGFKEKFFKLSKLNDSILALFFEKLLEHFPNEPATHRVVALQAGNIVGTLSIKWWPESELEGSTPQPMLPLWREFRIFGKGALLKLLLGLYFLSYKPQPGECYIADVTVHPNYRGEGIGKLMLGWAELYARAHPSFNVLSLHVSSHNLGAKRLYEQLSYHMHRKERSLLKYMLFHELEWEYMKIKLK
ncbi:GNAT family N-acetyltransferase [Paenibacillus sp. Leaf72]|uniref:GNAT family N-acetyltransferase n=1 Tax=Paenibacillus sp. Leaf72 TaxID=1736234 RepID=UPI0006F71CC4|nr:N-acetyltransferase [Paenibacillus sp. Leaf72]KQN97751.1 acetyltransferase [Paenibacillus sp. Leaf72]